MFYIYAFVFGVNISEILLKFRYCPCFKISYSSFLFTLYRTKSFFKWCYHTNNARYFFQSFNSFKTSLKYTWAVNVIQIIFLRFKFLVCNNGDSSKMILYGNVCGGNIYDDYLIYANICNRWIWYFLKIK